MRATEKTLSILIDEVNVNNAKAGLRPLCFIKETRHLKLQKRNMYQLYLFPQDGVNDFKALANPQSANALRLYLAGLLDGARIGMKIAAKEMKLKTQEDTK